jgi:hypothetical protein
LACKSLPLDPIWTCHVRLPNSSLITKIPGVSNKQNSAALGETFWTKVVAGYTAVGFVVMELLFFTAWCRPFEQYWQLPVQQGMKILISHEREKERKEEKEII